MVKAQTNTHQARESVFANLMEGEEIAFEFESNDQESRIYRVGRSRFGENLMATMIYHAGSGFMRVKNVDDIVDLINQALRLSRLELRYDHAYTKDGSAHTRVDELEADTNTRALNDEEKKEYNLIDQVRYRVCRI